MNKEDKHKLRTRLEIEKRGLTSIMNNTKWRAFCDAMYEALPFPPPYIRKDVLNNDAQPFDEDVWYIGNYDEGIHPFYSIEWIAVRPRRLISRGRLVKNELESIEAQFIEVLKKYHIPYQHKEDVFFIYGYASDFSVISKIS